MGKQDFDPAQRPTQEFVYPGGVHMCQSGKVRAAGWGKQILSGNVDLEQIEKMARTGERSTRQGADTNKRNLIAMMVFRHAKSGNLEKYTNEAGDFLDNGQLRNVNDSKFATLVRQLFGQGGDSNVTS